MENLTTIEKQSNAKYNEYLRSIMDPDHYTSGIPDANMNTSYLKTITLSDDLSCQIGDFLFLHKPSNKNISEILTLYAYDSVRGGYYMVADLPPDEDLSDAYKYARIVSGKLDVIASTISTTNVVISGIMNAVDYQELPDTTTLNFSKILSSKRNNIDVIPAQSVAIGVTSLMHPTGDQEYYLLESNASENTQNVLRVPYDSSTPTIDGWATSSATYKTLNVSTDFPSDIRGLVNFEINLDVVLNAQPSTTTFFEVTLRTLHKDPADWSTDVFETYTLPRVSMANQTINQSHKLSGETFLNYPLYDITVSCPTTVSVYNRVSWTLTSAEYYQIGSRGPGTIIAVSGIPSVADSFTAAHISLSGKYNYEAIPDATLARQITTTGPTTDDTILDLNAAQVVINKQLVQFLWSTPEYEAIIRMGSWIKLAKSDKTFAAAGLLDILKSVGETVLPVLGTVAGSLLGGLKQRGETSGLYKRRGMNTSTAGGLYKPKKSSGYGSGLWHASTAATEVGKWEAASVIDQSYIDLLGNAAIDIVAVTIDDEDEILDIDYNSDDWTNVHGMQIQSIATNYGGTQYAPLDWVRNAFPIINADEDTGTIGLAVVSTSLCSGDHYVAEVTIDYDNRIDFTYAVSPAGSTLDDEAVFAIANAIIAANVTHEVNVGQIYVSIQLPEVMNLTGSSLGLAVFLGLLKRQSKAYLTGFVDCYQEIYTPTKLLAKAKLAYSKNKPIIIPYDNSIPDEIRDNESTINWKKADVGDLITTDGRFPYVILCSNVSSYVMTANASNGMKRGGAKSLQPGTPVPSVTNMETPDNAIAFTKAEKVPTYHELVNRLDTSTNELLGLVKAGKLDIDPETLVGYDKNKYDLNQSDFGRISSTKPLLEIRHTGLAKLNNGEYRFRNKVVPDEKTLNKFWDDAAPMVAQMKMSIPKDIAFKRWKIVDLMSLLDSVGNYQKALSTRQAKKETKSAWKQRVKASYFGTQNVGPKVSTMALPKKAIVPTPKIRAPEKRTPPKTQRPKPLEPPPASTLMSEEPIDLESLLEFSEEEPEVQLKTKRKKAPETRTAKVGVSQAPDWSAILNAISGVGQKVDLVQADLGSVKGQVSGLTSRMAKMEKAFEEAEEEEYTGEEPVEQY